MSTAERAARISAALRGLEERGEVVHWTRGTNGKRSVWEVHFRDAYNGQHAHLFTPEMEQCLRARHVGFALLSA